MRYLTRKAISAKEIAFRFHAGGATNANRLSNCRNVQQDLILLPDYRYNNIPDFFTGLRHCITLRKEQTMAVRGAEAIWQGTLKEGSGVMKLGSGLYEGPYTYASRFEEGKGTNPEELIGAAHAGCYSMFLSALLTNNGTPPKRVHTTATVHLTAGPTVSKIELVCRADVDGVSQEKFTELAAAAKANCPISKALAAVPEIILDAQMVGA
jgi:osmotically inducible protein OsmC